MWWLGRAGKSLPSCATSHCRRPANNSRRRQFFAQRTLTGSAGCIQRQHQNLGEKSLQQGLLAANASPMKKRGCSFPAKRCSKIPRASHSGLDRANAGTQLVIGRFIEFSVKVHEPVCLVVR